MTSPCPPPANTGVAGGLPNTGYPLLAIIAVGAVLVVAGVVVVFLLRRGRPGSALLIGALLLLSILSLQPAPAQADPACPPAQPIRVAIIQTSVNSDLAPGSPPSLITGEVRNVSSVDVYVTQVSVTIEAITKAAGAAPGTCDLADYRLNATHMPVGVLLHPGDQAPFRGAMIGFVDRPVNQDACQGAVLTLKYVST